MFADDLKKLDKKIKKLYSKKIFNDKYIVIFGAAAITKVLRKSLLEYGIKINAIIDNDKRKIGKECLGLKVIKPEDLLEKDISSVVVILYSIFYEDMEYHLGKLGFKKQQIINVSPKNYLSDESLFYYLKNSLSMLSGCYYYRRINKKYPNNQAIFICPYTGTGDVYLVGLYFYQYLTVNNIDDYVFIVVNNACKKVAQIFSIQNIEVMPSEDVGKIIGARMFTEKLDSIVILNDSWSSVYTNPIQWIRGYKGLNFNEMFRNFVFGFSDEVDYNLPEYVIEQENIHNFFKENGLIPAKTIVLSPYSNTLFELPGQLWEEIVLLFQKRGFTVCTNSCGPNEPTIKGTAPVFFPLTIAKDVLDAAGYFIGVRSGLCDVISSSSCKKVIFYERDGFFYQSTTFEYFSLSKMGLCDDVLEIEYKYSDNRFTLLESIKNFCLS